MATQRTSTSADFALAGLSAATALGLTRVFAGGAWLASALLAAVLPHVLLARADRRRWPAWLALVAVVAAGVLFMILAVEPHTTNHGLPTTATLRALGSDLADAPSVLREAVVPVAPNGPALLLALVAIWVAATTARWSSHRLDAALGGIGSSLVLFVAVAALGEGSYVVSTAAYALAAATFLLLRQQHDLGERRTWFYARGPRRSRVVAGGVSAAVLAVVIGVVAGPVLPGARSDALLDYRDLGDKGDDGTWRTVTPMVELRPRLVQDPPVELFTVRSPRKAYWRLVALDLFDGEIWRLDTLAPEADNIPAPEFDTNAEVVVQQFTIERLAPRWLPAAYRPVDTDLAGTLVIPESATLVYGADWTEPPSYVVASEIAAPTRADLDAVAPAETGGALARSLDLPRDFPDDVRELALDITDEATGPYAQALALQEWFRDPDNFTYDLEARAGHSQDALRAFLFEQRRGYCEQFSGAFAAMARSIGIPARVAVGFTPGEYDAREGLYRVTTREAHAWPEVYLDGIGWMPFEPTPGRFEPSPGDPTGTGARDPAPTTTAPETATSSPTTSRGTPTTVDLSRFGEDRNIETGRTDPAEETPVVLRVLLGIAIIVAGGLGVATVSVVVVVGARMRRVHRRRHATDLRDRVTGAWAEALDRLDDAGIAPRASATPVEFALRHAPAQGAGEAGPPLMELAQLQTAALFAPSPPTDEDAHRAWEHLDAIAHAVKALTPRASRWRRVLDPRRLQRVGRLD